MDLNPDDGKGISERTCRLHCFNIPKARFQSETVEVPANPGLPAYCQERTKALTLAPHRRLGD
jgi:hypothetical protein